MVIIDEKILKDLKRGDHTAFRKVFNHYSSSLYKFAINYLKSNEVAEDIVQEVFLKIWNNRSEIKTNTSFQSYLFTITLNSVRKHFGNVAKINELRHEILFDLSSEKEELDDRTDYQYLLDKLDEFILLMPEKRKTVFVKKKIDGKSQREIAEEMGISEKTVEYHIAEAMKFLKDEFEKLHVSGLIFFHLFVHQTLIFFHFLIFF